MNYEILIGEGFLLIIIIIITIFFLFKDSNKGSVVDCIGSWSECNSDCTKKHTIFQKPNNGGKVCDDEDEVVKWCEPGEGKCLTEVDHDKHDKVCNIQHNIPQHANINNCPNSGIIAHGNSCDYKCNTRYKISGNPTIECNNGIVKIDSDFECVSDSSPSSSDDCVGSWSDCGYDCMKTYRIHKHSTGNGKPCINYDGEWAPCTSHETNRRCLNVIRPHHHYQGHDYHHLHQ